MLIKEYRIPLPLSVEEYKIAQLYMIAKISRDETKDAGSGIQILTNEPYENGPEGTNGQYTRKIYYVREYLPGWIKALLPKSTMSVEEEAWNAYPYTKTRYTSTSLEKFFIEIDTVYCDDAGNQTNVFNLSGNDLRNRTIDVIDVVLDSEDVGPDEDLTRYKSEKTSRGPLTRDWLKEYSSESFKPLKGKRDIMCAYKLCKVDFRYWGMQAKLEKYIHEFGLRKTMLKAHRRAWLWQDEWYDLTMNDIRDIERQTQEILRRKMAPAMGASPVESLGAIESGIQDLKSQQIQQKIHDNFIVVDNQEAAKSGRHTTTSNKRFESANMSSRQDVSAPSNAANKWQSLARDSDSERSNDEDDEFFDCQEDVVDGGTKGLMMKWSSMDLLTEEDNESAPLSSFSDKGEGNVFSCSGNLKRTCSERGRSTGGTHVSCPGSPTLSALSITTNTLSPSSKLLATNSPSSCKITTLLLVVHAGSLLETTADVTAKKSDVITLRGSFESVIRQHYPTMIGRIAIKLVPCPAITKSSLSILSNLSPYSFDVSPSLIDAPHFTRDSIPMGVIPVLSTVSSQYRDALEGMVSTANSVYHAFLKSESGLGFSGSVSIIGDSMGALLAHDALCPKYKDEIVIRETSSNIRNITNPSASVIDIAEERRLSNVGVENEKPMSNKFEFEVHDFFMFGSPIPLVLAFRRISGESKRKNDTDSVNFGLLEDFSKPSVQQVYNMFHPSDPVASRLEPLICNRFSMLSPVNISRYQKYPLGTGHPYHLLEVIQTNAHVFTEQNASPVTSVSTTVNNSMQMRRMSEASLFSNTSGILQAPLPIQIISDISQKWWGNKRLDYALYCPEGISNFPTNALPHLFHASYWESYDVVAFILRQIGGFDLMPPGGLSNEEAEFSRFVPIQPREKWIRKRTSVKLNKLKNIGANHRANDVIVKECAAQVLSARFMYGSYDVITLTGEKVDIYVMNDGGNSVADWVYLATQVTDKTGHILYTIPPEKSFSYGIHHVKMVVRGDHTSVDFCLAVVPPKTECVVFSIDGSFTASVSVTGRDPKVRAGAVDVVRQWQELGYLIVYISARPDMQQQMVLSWLTQHNFPYGLVAFADRFSTDPLGYKTSYLKCLTQECQANYFVPFK